jgi:hypothetical protein
LILIIEKRYFECRQWTIFHLLEE